MGNCDVIAKKGQEEQRWERAALLNKTSVTDEWRLLIKQNQTEAVNQKQMFELKIMMENTDTSNIYWFGHRQAHFHKSCIHACIQKHVHLNN